MRAKVKTARRKASKLHGASAQFVSLVDAGANETPFTLIKSRNGASAMTIKKRGKGKAAERKSHKTVNTPSRKKKAEAVETRTETLIAKMVFDAEIFETEEEVTEHLEAAEWDAEGTVVTKNADDNWEVRPEGLTDDDFDKIAEVETEEDGVAAFVGKREVEVKTTEADPDDEDASDDDDDDDEDGGEEEDEEDEDDDEDDAAELAAKGKKAPAKKSASKTKLSKRQEFLAKRKDARAKEQKFDAWDARFSKENTVAKALAAGMEWDGTPPGFYDVQAAFSGVTATIVGDGALDAAGKQEALNKAALDFAEIIGGLDSFFDAYVEGGEEQLSKHFDDEQRQALDKWAEDYADFASGEIATPVAKTSTPKAPVKKSAAKTNDDGITETVADIIAKAIEPLHEQVQEVSGTVEALAKRHPSKKAKEPEDGGPTKPRKLSKQEEAADRSAKDFANRFLG